MGKLTMTRRTFAKMTAATAAAVGIAGTGTALAEIGDAPFGRCQIGVELSLRPTKAAMPPADPFPAAWRPLKTSSLPQAAPSAWRHPIPLTPLQTGMSPSERGRFASQSAQRAYVWVALCFGFAFVGVLT